MDLLNQLNATQIAVLTTVVAGITELYGRLAAKDFFVAGKIVVAVVTGALIALSFGAGVVTALAIGFVAPGAITVVGSLGNKSKAAPSKLAGE